MDRYDPQAIEAKWQAEWEREGAFVVPNPSPEDAPHEHTYVLEMLPYPSGELHMGHVLNYTLGDATSRRSGRAGSASAGRSTGAASSRRPSPTTTTGRSGSASSSSRRASPTAR